jgi:DNA-binding response OmpR family regulator
MKRDSSKDKPPPPPLDPSPSVDERQRPGPGHASLRHSPPLILVVDDDAVLRQSLAEVLQLENFAVRLAGDGREAVRRFLEGPPDLILLDLNMPDINGWQAFQIMTELYPFVPVIVITARPGQAQRAAELGIDLLLEKPLHIPTLLESIRQVLARPENARLEKVMHAWRTHDWPGTQE